MSDQQTSAAVKDEIESILKESDTVVDDLFELYCDGVRDGKERGSRRTERNQLQVRKLGLEHIHELCCDNRPLVALKFIEDTIAEIEEREDHLSDQECSNTSQ